MPWVFFYPIRISVENTYLFPVVWWRGDPRVPGQRGQIRGQDCTDSPRGGDGVAPRPPATLGQEEVRPCQGQTHRGWDPAQSSRLQSPTPCQVRSFSKFSRDQKLDVTTEARRSSGVLVTVSYIFKDQVISIIIFIWSSSPPDFFENDTSIDLCFTWKALDS